MLLFDSGRGRHYSVPQVSPTKFEPGESIMGKPASVPAGLGSREEVSFYNSR